MHDLTQLLIYTGLVFVIGIEASVIFSKIWRRVVKWQTLNYMRNLLNYTQARHPCLSKNNFVVGKGIFNNECHNNSVQAVKDGIASGIILCICASRSEVFPHFINMTKNGKLIDNTFGWRYEKMDYYYVRDIREEEYEDLPRHIYAFNKKNIQHHYHWPFRKAVMKSI